MGIKLKSKSLSQNLKQKGHRVSLNSFEILDLRYKIYIYMAKRATGIEKRRTSRSKKTKKRLAIKREMLKEKASKKSKKSK